MLKDVMSQSGEVDAPSTDTPPAIADPLSLDTVKKQQECDPVFVLLIANFVFFCRKEQQQRLRI